MAHVRRPRPPTMNSSMREGRAAALAPSDHAVGVFYQRHTKWPKPHNRKILQTGLQITAEHGCLFCKPGPITIYTSIILAHAPSESLTILVSEAPIPMVNGVYGGFPGSKLQSCRNLCMQKFCRAANKGTFLLCAFDRKPLRARIAVKGGSQLHCAVVRWRKRVGGPTCDPLQLRLERTYWQGGGQWCRPTRVYYRPLPSICHAKQTKSAHSSSERKERPITSTADGSASRCESAPPSVARHPSRPRLGGTSRGGRTRYGPARWRARP